MSVPHFAVVGWPIAHSRSPEIFATLSAMTGLGLVYDRLAIEPGTFERRVREERSAYRGWNVTAPHKVAALACADEATADARAVGAANVLAFAPHAITAANTDVGGVAALCAAHGVLVRGARVRVLGAGGASRATVLALAQQGAHEVIIANRSAQRAADLVTDLQPHCGTTQLRAGLDTTEAAIIINATSDGAAVQDWIATCAPDGWCIDLQYRPRDTPFVVAARARGRRAVNGTGMLVAQAIAAFRLWFGAIAIDERAAGEQLSAIVEAA